MNRKMQNRLAMLLAMNVAAPRAYAANVNAATGEAELLLFDTIGYDWWTGEGVTAKQFAKDLASFGDKTLNLRVNSPGGDVFEGRAMVAALQSYPGKVVAHVEGVAASAASFLVMHADEVVMTEGSFLMIHNGWTIAVGDRNAMREQADILDKIDASIADDYMLRATLSREDIVAAMDAETWISAKEAVEQGFANSIAATRKDSKHARWNLAAYDNTPAPLAEEPVHETTPPASPVIDPDHAAEARMRRLALVERSIA